MSAYYPTAASHISHRHETPVVYSSSHRSHGTPYVAGSHAYSQNPSNYGAENVIYVPSSSHGHGHSRGHGHRSHHYGTVAPTTVISAGDGHRHHRSIILTSTNLGPALGASLDEAGAEDIWMQGRELKLTDMGDQSTVYEDQK
ncbi:hypothetical protein D9757_000093 [Collybiopsis confluens]|uniref:Uncharacterized protein n=1 Tax=Collybiopsis confluens TaxID=2823264 RepID=A0A8H5MHA3_9AGAR|nr:hypothetical protein D9757_000093 [Collybiopsis confluens]